MNDNLSGMDLRYLALAIEFEGTIGVYRYNVTPKGGKTYECYNPIISVGQVLERRQLLDKLFALTAVGTVKGRNDKVQPNHRAMGQWQVFGSEAVALAGKLEPYLVTKRRQAQLVAAYVVGKRGLKVSEESLAARRAAYGETLQLNRTGPRSPEPSWAKYAEEWLEWCARTRAEDRMRLMGCSLDFEGNVAIERFKSEMGHRGVSHKPIIYVAQVEHRKCLMEIVMALARCGAINSMRPAEGNHAATLRWQISGPKASTLAKDVADHLLAKRDAAMALASFPFTEQERCQRDPVPQSMFDRREALYNQAKDQT